MEEDDLVIQNIIEDNGIGIANNVLEDMIEEDGIGVADQDDHYDGTSAYDNDDEDNIDIPILDKAHEPLY